MVLLNKVPRRWRWACFMGLWLAVTWGTLGSPPPLPSVDVWMSIDKLLHFGAWALLTATGLWAWSSEPPGLRVCLSALVLAILYGLAIECIQGWTRDRSQEWLDLLADALGAATVIAMTLARSRGRRSG